MKKIKIITIILAIILVSLVSFVGVYVKVQNRMENQIKDYDFAMNLSGYRQIILTPVVEDEENQTETTKEQFEQCKKIIIKRLETLGITDYLIRTNNTNIVLEIPEDENTDYVVSNIASQGKFEIVDSETKEILMNNDDIKLSNVLYYTTESGTIVCLNIEFTKEGREKLTNITNEYKTIDEENNEESTTETTEETTEETTDNTAEEATEETEEETVQPEITMQIDESEMLTQSFDEPITTGKMQLELNTATTDTDILQRYIRQGTNIASISPLYKSRIISL